MHALFRFLVLGDVFGVSDIEEEEEEEASPSSLKQFMHSTNTLERALILWKYMINEHVIMNLMSLNKNSTPYLFMDLAKWCVFRESVPRALKG